MNWKINLSAILGLALFAKCAAPETESRTPSEFPEVTTLVKAQDLEHLERLEGGIAIVDMRPPEAYKAGHIKGAVSIWRTDIERHDLAYGGMALEKENLQRLLGSKGISDANRVVVYDDKGCVDAARLWWILKLYGHEKVSLLDGGLHAWHEILDTITTERQPVEFSFSELKEKHLNLDFEAFENLRKTDHVKLIDSRSYEEFDGQLMKDGAFLAGRIPGALNQCYSGSIDFSEGGERKLKPESDLRSIYEKLAMPDDTVIVYCHSGVRSAHTYMVLTEILGYQNVYNYDGSWIEWSFKQTHPSEEFSTR